MKGFTYLEITIAVFIMVIILVSLHSAFYFNVETVQKIRHQSETARVAGRVLFQMAKDIESVFPGGGTVPTLERKTIHGRAADTIALMTLSGASFQRGSAGTDLAKITYFAKSKAGEKGFSLCRRAEGIAGSDIVVVRKTCELATRIKAMDIGVETDSGNRLDEVFATSERRGKSIPVVIRIVLTLEDASGRERTFITSAQLRQ